MILVKGQILRFKNRNAKVHCDEVERELQGYCKRTNYPRSGVYELEITDNVNLTADKPSGKNGSIVAFDVLQPGEKA